MDIIDSIKYESHKKTHYTSEEILEAYKVLFKPDSLIARIVMQDLLTFTNYHTNQVCTDGNLYYHANGMMDVINRVKDRINSPILDESIVSDIIEDTIT